jgi:hypothetical protein
VFHVDEKAALNALFPALGDLHLGLLSSKFHGKTIFPLIGGFLLKHLFCGTSNLDFPAAECSI